MQQSSFYKETFQGILNQYLLKFRVEQRLQFKANILLIVAGIYGFVILSMDILSITYLQWISFIPLIILYIYSIYIIATPPALWPWVTKEKFEQLIPQNNSEQVYSSLINQMYKLTGEVDKPLRQYLIYLWTGVYLLSLSVLWTITIYFVKDDPLSCIITILIVIAIIVGIGIWLYWDKGIKKVVDKWKSMN